MPHFLDDRDLDRTARLAVLEAAWAFKHGQRDDRPLAGRHVALIMAKPSLRTRVSFTRALHELGAEVVEVGAHNTKLGKGEELEEWAGVLGRLVHGMVARVFAQEELEGLARFGGVPVVNALSDLLHPCQALSDAFTPWEHARRRGDPDTATATAYYARPRRWAWIGDGNNVCHSLMLTAASLGVELQIAAPPSRQPDATLVAAAQALHPRGADGVRVGTDPRAAVAGAHAVHTDTWVSMGQEGAMTEAQVRHVFEPYRVDDALLALADPSAVFLHCLPAEPGNEVTPAVLRGPRSLILDQAENRLWTTKAVLAHHVFPRPTT